jgi:hypothetical protein
MTTNILIITNVATALIVLAYYFAYNHLSKTHNTLFNTSKNLLDSALIDIKGSYAVAIKSVWGNLSTLIYGESHSLTLKLKADEKILTKGFHVEVTNIKDAVEGEIAKVEGDIKKDL